MHKWALVKNTPQTSKDLNHIKHLIRIQPVSFPDGLPSSEEDYVNFRLLPNGNFVRRGASPFRPGKPIELSECEILQKPLLADTEPTDVSLL